jgi:predicted Ser/Thr protein kinase
MLNDFVVTYEHKHGRQEDLRRHANQVIQGGRQIHERNELSGGKAPVEDAKVIAQHNAIIDKTVSILRGGGSCDSTRGNHPPLFDAKGVACILHKGLNYLEKQPLPLLKSLYKKLPRHMATNMILENVLTYSSSDSLVFDQSKTVYEVDCLKGYTLIKTLGAGTYGEVSLVEKKGKECAVKRVPVYNQANINTVRNEIDIMLKLKGTNIGPILHDYMFCKSEETGNAMYLFMEYFNLGTLAENQVMFDKNPRLQKQLNSKMARLHALGIRHNDVSNNKGNVLLHRHTNGKVEVYLGDFGRAQTTEEWLTSETTSEDAKFYAELILASICHEEHIILI